MAIILDTEDLTGKTYTGYFENLLFPALATCVTSEKFLYPLKRPWPGATPVNMQAIDFPAAKGLFYQHKIEKWLKEHTVSAFISFGRVLKTKAALKQVLIINNAALIDEPSVAIATAIGFTTRRLLKSYTTKYPGQSAKAFLIDNPVQKPDIRNDTEQIKKELTKGLEFFICTDLDLTSEKLVVLLKAFSAFKRMLQSSWKLVLVLRSADAISIDEAKLRLSNYKYREDVLLTGDEGLDEKIAAAYALVTISDKTGYPLPAAEAIQLTVPVISIPNPAIKEIYDDKIVYATGNTSEAIGEMLIMIYKAEAYRRELIKKIGSVHLLTGIEQAAALIAAKLT